MRIQNAAAVEEVGGVFHSDSHVGNSTFLVFSQYFPKEIPCHCYCFQKCWILRPHGKHNGSSFTIVEVLRYHLNQIR